MTHSKEQTPVTAEQMNEGASRNGGPVGSADAGPCPRSPVSWDEAPVGVQLWGVYGNDCFPTIFACKMLDYPSGMRAIWGFSVYRRKPAYRTLGQNHAWAVACGLRLFLTREAAFASIAAYFPDDGAERVHTGPLSAASAAPNSSPPSSSRGDQ